jgi:hypothetical protein
MQRFTQLNSSCRVEDIYSQINNKSVLRSRLIQPAPMKPQREACGSNPFALSNHEEQDMPFVMADESSGFLKIETNKQAPGASSKESLLNTINIGNRGQFSSVIKAQAYLVKNQSVLLTSAPDKRFKANDFDNRPITKKLKKSGDQT